MGSPPLLLMTGGTGPGGIDRPGEPKTDARDVLVIVDAAARCPAYGLPSDGEDETLASWR